MVIHLQEARLMMGWYAGRLGLNNYCLSSQLPASLGDTLSTPEFLSRRLFQSSTLVNSPPASSITDAATPRHAGWRRH